MSWLLSDEDGIGIFATSRSCSCMIPSVWSDSIIFWIWNIPRNGVCYNRSRLTWAMVTKVLNYWWVTTHPPQAAVHSHFIIYSTTHSNNHPGHPAWSLSVVLRKDSLTKQMATGSFCSSPASWALSWQLLSYWLWKWQVRFNGQELHVDHNQPSNIWSGQKLYTSLSSMRGLMHMPGSTQCI